MTSRARGASASEDDLAIDIVGADEGPTTGGSVTDAPSGSTPSPSRGRNTTPTRGHRPATNSPKPKKKYTPPPIPDVCDGEHCAGCLADAACEEHGDHCMWNKKKNVCYPKKIKLFGHEIDLTKLHNEEM